jgi:putative MATE family efflux protein
MQEQEVAPDAAGLEPSTSGVAEPSAPPFSPATPSPSGSNGDTLRKMGPPAGKSTFSRAALPVTVGTIMGLALPTVFEQLLSAAIGFTDTIVAGHTGGDEITRGAAAGAVGAMTYLQWFAGLMTSALGVGATAIVARSIGARKPRMASRVAGTACAAAFLVGIFVAILFYAGAWPLVWMLGLRDQAASLGVDYLRIMCWTVCLQTAGQIGMACLRGSGDTIRPLVVTCVVTLVNCFFSPALTFGWFGMPAWGVKGNATGTLLAFFLAGLLTFAFLISGNAGLKLRLTHFKIIPHLLMRVVRIGLPSWVEGIILWGGQAVVVTLVMKQVDDAVRAAAGSALNAASGMTMAAHSATLRIESLAFLPGYGFGIACSALVGQYLGAKKPDEAERATRLCNRLALVTMTTAALPMIFAPHWMLSHMVDSAPVVQLGIIPLILAGLAQPPFAISIIKSSALKGAGDTRSPLWASLVGMGGRVVVVLTAMAFLARSGHAAWGLVVVWICIFLDLTWRAVFLRVVFRRGKWKQVKV